MALVAKMLGGIGKAVVGAGGTVLKSGAKFLGDDAVEALGRGVGKAQKGLDDIVQAAVKQDEIYKAAKNEARGIKEARGVKSESAKEAILRGTQSSDGTISFKGKDGVTYERHKNPNWKEGDVRKSSTNPNGRNQYLYTANGQSINGQAFGKAKSSFTQDGGTFSDIADDISKTAAGDGSGIDLLQFASDHPVGTALAGLGVGIIGAELLDDD